MSDALGGLFSGGGVAEQFFVWGVLYEVAQTVLAPLVTDLTYAVQGAHPVVELSPADLADMVIRNLLDQADAEGRAKKFGLSADRFDLLVKDAGEPPGLEFLLEAWRRGYIPWDSGSDTDPSVRTGVRQSRTKDMWTDTIHKMAEVPLPPAVAVDAVVEGQIPHDEAATKAYASGVTPEDFQIMVNTRGNPPSLTELLELYRRKLIPAAGTGPDALTFQQGIYEGASKDKWEPLLLRLADYLPPPRTITALERAGAIDATQAAALYEQAGLTPALAAIYSATASNEKMAGSKQLAESAVLNVYEAGLIPQDEARTLLAAMGYASHEVDLLISYRDLQQSLKAMTAAVARTHTLYVGHKLSQVDATNNLNALGVPAAAQQGLLAVWELERASNVKVLTAAEITDAFAYLIMDQATAQNELMALGYSAYDAWVMLSVKNKAALGNQPPASSAVPVPPFPTQGV